MGSSRKLAAASLLAVICIGVQVPMLRRLLKGDDVPIYRKGAGFIGPGSSRFAYRGAIAVEKGGRATSVERFVLQPPEPDPRLVPEELAPRILDAEWQAAKEVAGVTATSERVALSEEGRDGLQITLGGPIKVRILYLPRGRFAWLRGLLRAAFLHRAVVHRFSLLIWPAGLVTLWLCRQEIRGDLEWIRTRKRSPPPASA